MKKGIITAGIGLGVLASGMALAGYKSGGNVTVTVYSDGSKYVSGKLGSARNSSDNTQYIGCYHRVSSSSEWVVCQARNTSGTYASCISYDSRYFDVVDGMDSDSTLTYSANSSGYCTDIVHQTRSQDAPKEP